MQADRPLMDQLHVKTAALVMNSAGLTNPNPTGAPRGHRPVHPGAIGRCRISQPQPSAQPLQQGTLENVMQSQGVSNPGRETPDISSHVNVNAGRVAADPLDLGRAALPAQAIFLEGQLNGKAVKFMLDSGAMGNFVSSEWIKASHVKAVSRASSKVLQLPDGSKMSSTQFLPTTNIKLFNSQQGRHDHCEKMSFDVADLQGYDAILGKPWLDKHNPAVDWKSHIVTPQKRWYTVTLKQSFSKKLQQQSDLTSEAAKAIKSGLLSAKQMQRLMRKKNGTFFVAFIQELQELNAVSQSESSQPQSESAKVVLTEFSDVFPSDLPSSLPPNREVDHVIEVIPGSHPPSKPTYPLSYKELDELKTTLADLSKHGFARPSKSPYGAPVLLQIEPP